MTALPPCWVSLTRPAPRGYRVTTLPTRDTSERNVLGDKAWGLKYAGREALPPRAFLRAFLDHYSIPLYGAIAVGALVMFLLSGTAFRTLALALAMTVAFYSLVEYVLHRWLLHATFLCRSPLTSRLWRRLHYDHHMDPNDLSVLYANPVTSIPLLVLLAAIPALVLGSWGLFWAMLVSNFCAFVYYEFMHTLAHLPNSFQARWLREKKRNHLFHHVFDEHENYGIGSNLLDREIDRTPARGRSATVNNLGYDDAMASRYPWVRQGYEQDYPSGRGRKA